MRGRPKLPGGKGWDALEGCVFMAFVSDSKQEYVSE